MKVSFLVIVFFCCLITTAQKSVYITNYSSYNITVGSIATKPATATYPTFVSNTPNIFLINAVQSYTLINTNNAKFPFLSPSSVPQYTNWRKSVNGTPTGTSVVTSAATYNSLDTNTQIFSYFKFGISNSGGTLGPSPYPSTASGPGWLGIYSTNSNETIIEFFDN